MFLFTNLMFLFWVRYQLWISSSPLHSLPHIRKYYLPDVTKFVWFPTVAFFFFSLCSFTDCLRYFWRLQKNTNISKMVINSKRCDKNPRRRTKAHNIYKFYSITLCITEDCCGINGNKVSTSIFKRCG